MSRFYSISRSEMENFLFPQGFQALKLDGTRELVYARIVKHEGFTMSMRIYTGIEPNGVSRDCGDDAIRVQLFWRYESEIVPVGKSLKVLRVRTWAKNLAKAIIQYSDNFQTCPACGSPMVHRKGKNGMFWGCVTWHKTKCSGKAKSA